MIKRQRYFRAGLLPLFLCFSLSASAPQAATLGDMTGEGLVTVEDAVKILKCSVGLEAPTDEQRLIGDVFPARPGYTGRTLGEYPLNVQDAIWILKFSVGLISLEELGVQDTFLAISPTVVDLGPRDQQQFVAVPFNFTGPVEWSLASSGSSQIGVIGVNGLYIAPDTVARDFSVSVYARVGGMEKIAAVFLYQKPPPSPTPPPPPPA
ncbi:MAG: hypothetical protein KY468_17430 [Armatimonadetes bacterium]|nr:hypothetical protein [Armatimonadota bacterium]